MLSSEQVGVNGKAGVVDAMSLLLVDDSNLFQRVAARFLASYAQVRLIGSAASAEEALAKAETLLPEVVLLDINLPKVSGLDIIPRLRRLLPNVKIIVMTLWDSDLYRQAALEAGADDFVPKSHINTDLMAAIERARLTPPRPPIG